MKKNISIAISISLLIFSILLFSYVLYRSEIYHNGTKLNYYYKYYFISILFLIFSFISFFLNKELKLKITTTLVSIIISLYIVEILIFTLKDDYSNGKFYKKLKKEYKELVVRIPPNFYALENNKEIFPLSGISNKYTILCKEYDDVVIYKSDRYGFNNLDSVWDEKKIEYLIIGDSYAHGDCVERKDNLSGNLEKISNKKVINLGYAGNGPLIAYASIREYLPLIKAKKLLWVYFEGNDLNFSNLGTELQQEILLNYLNDPNYSQNLYLKQNQIDFMAQVQLKKSLRKFEEKLINDKYKIIKLFNIRYFLANFKSKNKRESYKINEEFKKIILLTKNLAIKNNMDLYFIYIPDNYRYIGEEYFSEKDIHDYKKIMNYLKKLNIPVIDMHSELLKKDVDTKLKRSKEYHFTRDGYKTIAEYIFKYIVNHENKL